MLAGAVLLSTFNTEHLQHWCEKCQNKISLIQAALDAAARTALEEAARDMESTDRWAAKWLRARAASLGEQKE